MKSRAQLMVEASTGRKMTNLIENNKKNTKSSVIKKKNLKKVLTYYDPYPFEYQSAKANASLLSKGLFKILLSICFINFIRNILLQEFVVQIN